MSKVRDKIDPPLISIVIASRNAASTLEQCFDSIICQRFPSWEIVIVDGASEDSTLDLIRERGSWIHYWESTKDHGICQAWNRALNHITGQWVLFLGADDYLWSAETLEHIVPYLRSAYPRNLLVYGNVAVINSRAEVISTLGDPWPNLRRRMRRTMALPHQGVFHHKTLFRAYGAFDETFKIMGDYEFLSRVIWDHPPTYMQDLTVAAWRQGGISMNIMNVATVVSERLRVRQRHNIRQGAPVLPFAYAEEFARLGTRLLLGEKAMRRVQRLYHNVVD